MKNRNTRKLIVLALMMIINCSVFAQFYSSVGATNNGFQFEAGTIVNQDSKVDGLLFASSFTFSANKEKGSILTGLIGYKIDISEKVSITPKIGGGINYYNQEIKVGEVNEMYKQTFNYETYVKTIRGAVAYNIELLAHNYWRGVYVYVGYNRVYQYGIGFKFSSFYKSYD